MNLNANLANDILIVRVEDDRIDAACAIQFKEQMRVLIATPSPRVLLDLSQVAFLDSSGLGAIVAVMKLLSPDRKLELAGLTPSVEKVMHLTRMNTVLEIHPTVPDSIRQGFLNAD
jgi:anti-sigma B factor antagonist